MFYSFLCILSILFELYVHCLTNERCIEVSIKKKLKYRNFTLGEIIEKDEIRTKAFLHFYDGYKKIKYNLTVANIRLTNIDYHYKIAREVCKKSNYDDHLYLLSQDFYKTGKSYHFF